MVRSGFSRGRRSAKGNPVKIPELGEGVQTRRRDDNALESHRGGPGEESSFLVNGLLWSDAEFLYEAKHSLRPAKPRTPLARSRASTTVLEKFARSVIAPDPKHTQSASGLQV